MSQPDDGRVGAVSPDVDGDAGDRSLTDQGDPSVTRDRAAVERGEKRAEYGGSEDAQGSGGGADPSSFDPENLVEGGPTQAGGTADEPATAPDPGTPSDR